MAFADLGGLETLSCSFAEGVATIALNRPDKLNAVCRQMHADFRTALDALETDANVRCLVLRGEGRAFCSGQDLTEDLSTEADGKPDLGEALDRDYNPLVERLTALRIPVIAAVNGVAAGAGANLALVCDIVLAGESALFVEAFCRISLIPDAGGTWVLPRLVGRQRALAMMMTGEPVDAKTAKDWGMVWAVYPDADLVAETQAFAARLASGPTAAFTRMKQAVESAWDNTLPQQLAVERDLQAECGKLDDFIEGVTAFGEKRAAKFRGK